MLRTLLCAATLFFTTLASACANEVLNRPEEVLSIVGASVTMSESNEPLFVTVIGSIQNKTGKRVNDLVVEAEILDASGKVIDVLTEPLYGLVAPPNDKVVFRLQGPAATERSKYVGVRARVTSGTAHSAGASRRPRTKDSGVDWGSLLISWAPMLLLIAAWLLIVRKYNGKGSLQNKMHERFIEQNELVARQVVALESIASRMQENPPQKP